MTMGEVNPSFDHADEEHHHRQGTSKHADFKHLQEHYDEITDTKLPENLHRGDITTVNRFLGYHDAMMATCGTFLVLPLRNLKNMVKTGEYDDLKKKHALPHDPIVVDDLAGYLYAMRSEFIMFFLGFLIICNIWETNIIRTNVIKRFDDFMVLLGLFQMAAIVVLPFSIALNGAYPKEDITIAITTIVLIIINIFELIMILYGFYCPRLLNMAMKDWSNKEVRNFMLILCIKPIVEIIIIGIAGAFTFLNYRISWVLLFMLVVGPLFRKLGFYLRRKNAGENKTQRCRFFSFYTKGQISRERVEAMSDAAIAIIACVLILDITVEEFPTKHAVHEQGLVAVLSHMLSEFRVFFGAYMGVTSLWYVNHTVLHLFHTIDIGALYLQKIFLAFLCFLPITNNMVVKHGAGKTTEAERQLTVRWVGGIFLAAGLTQLLMVIWGYYRRDKLLHRWATCTDNNHKNEMNLIQFRYVRFKIAVIPFFSLIGIFGSFAPGDISYYILTVCVTCVMVTFLLLKFVFMNHINKPAILFTHDNGKMTTRQKSVDEIELRKEMKAEIADGKVYDNEKEMERKMIAEAEKREIEEEMKDEKEEEALN
ncbi:endosomal/lysosomal proton channel TMEM175-like [Clytia hemisphaerica]|uniref:Endosomal/lysosomal proton channel TMEM175 n=1 Tax=Clytia hemisphaerica TaxID=252671 RepID=A0A7M5V9T9_9CNID